MTRVAGSRAKDMGSRSRWLVATLVTLLVASPLIFYFSTRPSHNGSENDTSLPVTTAVEGSDQSQEPGGSNRALEESDRVVQEASELSCLQRCLDEFDLDLPRDIRD